MKGDITFLYCWLFKIMVGLKLNEIDHFNGIYYSLIYWLFWCMYRQFGICFKCLCNVGVRPVSILLKQSAGDLFLPSYFIAFTIKLILLIDP